MMPAIPVVGLPVVLIGVGRMPVSGVVSLSTATSLATPNEYDGCALIEVTGRMPACWR
jgi:hypothetical protein